MRVETLIGLLAPVCLAAGATAQCKPEWLSRPEQGWIGVGGEVRAVTVHDDGGGPVVFVAGRFDLAGRSAARSVARWDGAEWQALGPGLSFANGTAGRVLALASHAGELVAGGSFVAAGPTPTRYIASWDGHEWRALGSGTDDFVLALTSFNGDLIAGGEFTQADGIPALHIARWDGAAWQPLGSGVAGRVQALAVYDGDLIAGQRYTSTSQTIVQLARWDGVQWSTLAGGVSGLYPEVRALCVFEGDLIVGGQFAGAGGVVSRCVARWDGAAWHPLGPGIAGTGDVWALAASANRLFVGGSFTSGPGHFIQGWNGAAWETLQSGSSDEVRALAVHADDLIVGGHFTHASDTSVNYCARWDGGDWNAMGPGFNGEPRSMLLDGDELIAGGVFSVAGGVPTSAVARWDGTQWQGIGPGLGNMPVYAIRKYGGELVAAGYAPGSHIKRWDGSSWATLGGGVSHLVYALEEHAGELVVAGSLTSAGTVTASRIARWDGAQWHALGSGIQQGPINLSGTDSVVYALGRHGNDLIVGGKFIGAGGAPAMNIARWDGAGWSALAGGLGNTDADSYVLSVAEFRGDLIAAGGQLSINGGPYVNVARWDGAAWQPLGGPASNAVTLAKVIGDDLIIGGRFTSVAGLPASSIARWDGLGWHALDAGISGTPPNQTGALPTVSDAIMFNNEMIVGGYFTKSGGGVTAFWARWGCQDCYADCTGDGSLSVADFGCFQTRFVTGDPYADCNADGSLNVSDFGCFQTRYVTECN